MPKFMQEKFQIYGPAKEEAGEQWASFESAREPQFDPNQGFNYLPPGMDISAQQVKQIKPMPLSMAGETDVTNCSSPDRYTAGFKHHSMKNTDDQYTGEHADLFYGTVHGENAAEDRFEGFVERNNYLDRI